LKHRDDLLSKGSDKMKNDMTKGGVGDIDYFDFVKTQ